MEHFLEVANADERSILLARLERQRALIVKKASGLTDAQAATSLVASPTTVTGLVQHLALVERAWFRRVFANDGYEWSYDFDADEDAEFRVTSATSLADALADYQLACEESRAVCAAANLDDAATGPRDTPPEHPSLRWIIVHLLVETAQHNGHLDILREQLDGVVGL